MQETMHARTIHGTLEDTCTRITHADTRMTHLHTGARACIRAAYVCAHLFRSTTVVRTRTRTPSPHIPHTAHTPYTDSTHVLTYIQCVACLCGCECGCGCGWVWAAGW